MATYQIWVQTVATEGSYSTKCLFWVLRMRNSLFLAPVGVVDAFGILSLLLRQCSGNPDVLQGHRFYFSILATFTVGESLLKKGHIPCIFLAFQRRDLQMYKQYANTVSIIVPKMSRVYSKEGYLPVVLSVRMRRKNNVFLRSCFGWRLTEMWELSDECLCVSNHLLVFVRSIVDHNVSTPWMLY